MEAQNMSKFTLEALMRACGLVDSLWLDAISKYGAGHPQVLRWSRQADVIREEIKRRDSNAS